jgi:hypothetical protein
LKHGCTAAIVISLADVDTKTTYNPGGTYVSPGFYGGYGGFGGYYGYRMSVVSSPGYISTSKKYTLESVIYDLAKDKKEATAWVGQADITDPGSVDSAIRFLSRSLLKELKKQEIIE